MGNPLERLTTALSDRYAIERELGVGGMATVYLARDLRHDRLVALKVLRPELGAVLGTERFLSEIRVTASLQHPHVLPLFDSGNADGLIFYVMPHVAGESLRDRLGREKQLGVAEAIEIARAVASALDYAHRKGIIHRDIKPENILFQDGQAVVADFGIALAVSTAGGSRLTETGLSLGTPYYMSPEQATGDRQVDARSDIYSLAAVTYEMLAGEPPHTGPTVQAVIAKVVTDRPQSLRAARDTVPPHLEAAVLRALAKVPADRFHSAAEFAEALVKPGLVALPAEASLVATGSAPSAPPRASPRAALALSARVAPWALAGGFAALAAFALLRSPTLPPPGPVSRFSLQLPQDASLGTASGSTIAMSPDGSRIVYVGIGAAGSQLFLRGLDQLDPAPLAGTLNAVGPFFSPDGQWVAFFAGGKLAKLPLSGGPALTVAPVSGVWGDWGLNDSIVFHSDSGLMVVSAAGGEPRLLLRADTARRERYMFPQYLPNRRGVLFYIRGTEDHLAALDLRTGLVKRFDQAGINPRYVSTGHVVLATRTGTLIALPFDASRLEITGSPVPVAENVVVGGSGAAKLGMSRDGEFAYQVGQAGVSEMVMVDRSGAVRPLPAEPQDYYGPRLSPDGRRIAVQVSEGSSPNVDVWVYDIAQRTRTRLTFDQTGQRPAWTPDGRRVIYSRGSPGNVDLAWIPSDGSGPADSLYAAPDDQWAGEVSLDGSTLVFRSGAGGNTRRSIHYLPLRGERAARAFLENQFDNHSPSLSPDGRWVAYVSDESGRPEVYVRPFPGPGGRWQVSLDGGSEPRWSPTGREILYRNGNRMMAAAVQLRPSFNVAERRQLFEANFAAAGVHPDYDVARDGRTLLMVRPVRQNQAFVVVLNWFTNLRRQSSAPGAARNAAR